MDDALIVFSRNGMFTTTMRARDVQSREHARKLWPLVTQSLPRELVTWVSPTFKPDGELLRRSHFRRLPGSRNPDLKKYFEDEEEERQKISRESPEHIRAKTLIAEALKIRQSTHHAMPWYFADPSSSEFHLSGNLLLGADQIQTERRVKTSFGSYYQLDVAVISKPINEQPIILGGIEIEWGHPFDGRKALIGKSQAFPLLSIDITGMSLSDLTPEWADYALTCTTRSSEKGHRKTYIYLHDLLYPLYLQLPALLLKDRAHQFLVFAKDDELKSLLRWIQALSQKLAIPASASLSASIVNAKSEQSRKMLINAGDVVGPDWAAVNDHQCLRITIDRPVATDVQGHLFHLTLAHLLLCHMDSLVGYKYCTGINNEDLKDDLWTAVVWDSEKKEVLRYRVAPKRLAEPRSRIVEVINSLGAS